MMQAFTVGYRGPAGLPVTLPLTPLRRKRAASCLQNDRARFVFWPDRIVWPTALPTCTRPYRLPQALRSCPAPSVACAQGKLCDPAPVRPVILLPRPSSAHYFLDRHAWYFFTASCFSSSVA